MILARFTIALLGPFIVRALQTPTSGMSARDFIRRRGAPLTVMRREKSRASSTVYAATSGGNDNDLSSVRDIVYLTSVSIAGKEYQVQIDTGSSDLWVRTDNITGAQVSNLSGNITYGIGWAAGSVAQASVSFAGFNISSQAFMMATAANNPILNWGAEGLLGLGLNSLSTVDSIVSRTGASWGRTLLYNIFSQSPKTPNFIAFLLQRSEHKSGNSSEGSFTIGELEPEFEAAINATEAIPTWPPSKPTRWTVLVDGYDTTGAVSHTFKSKVPGVATGSAVALLDSGTSYSYASEEFCKSLYSSVPGATFSSALGQWVVPCNQEVNVGLIIGGRRFPVHPLDIIAPSLTGSDNATCYGTFIPQTFAAGAGEFDLLLGDMFLRNVYSVYDLGDFVDDQATVMGDPYIKLLSITNATSASAEFHQVRGGSPSDANRISNAQSPTGYTSSSSMISTSSDKLDRLIRYAEALLGLLAISVLLLLSAFGAIVYYVFFRRRRDGPNRTSPDESGFSGLGLGNLRSPGPVYQPVPSTRHSMP